MCGGDYLLSINFICVCLINMRSYHLKNKNIYVTKSENNTELMLEKHDLHTIII